MQTDAGRSSSIATERAVSRLGFWARVLTSLAGVWLLLSAFLWEHQPTLFTNTWVVGAGIFLSGLWRFRESFARWVGAALALWLICVSWFTWQISAPTTWNNVLVSVVVFGLAWISDEAG